MLSLFVLYIYVILFTYLLSIVSDTVYFHMKDVERHKKRTVYGVSCYRQIDAKVA